MQLDSCGGTAVREKLREAPNRFDAHGCVEGMETTQMYAQMVTFLYVSDLERSASFYRERIGLELVLEQPGCRIFRVSSTGFLGVCERETGEKPSIIVTFVPDDLEATHERLVELGVECDGPPRYNERYDIVQFFASDPDGYTLEFQRFCSDDWPS